MSETAKTSAGGAWRVDAHRHYWDPATNEYSWMPTDGLLARAYLPGELEEDDSAAGFMGSVVVQAAPTREETRFLTGWAARRPDILGVVGWVDLAARDVEAQLESIADDRLVGVRAMIQDIPDDAWVDSPAVRRGLHALVRADLPFEAVLYPRQLPALVSAVSAVDGLRVVIDHLAKARYGSIEPEWEVAMDVLARRGDSVVKISALATELDDPDDTEALRPHVDFVLDRFGADRCMLGTDWPVSLLAHSFADTVRQLDDLVAGSSEAERRALWRETAARTYGLSLTDRLPDPRVNKGVSR